MGSDDRYIEGFLAGQAVAYCERVKTGMSLAAQLVCPSVYADALCQIIATEGCSVLRNCVEEQESLWIYRDELAARLVTQLQAAQESQLGIWCMGKLLGYASSDVAAFVSRSTKLTSLPGSNPHPS